MRRMLLAPFILSLGCYLSHERPAPSDAGPTGDGTDTRVVVPPVDPIERRIPGIEPYLGWDGDEVALVALPDIDERRVLHRFTASLEPTAAVPLDDGLVGGVAWSRDRIGVCAANLATEPTFREYSMDGTAVLSERPMFCTALAAWGGSWGALVEGVEGATDRSVVRIGGAALPLGPSDEGPVHQGAMVAVGDDLVFAYVTVDLDVVLIRLAPDGTVRARYQLYGYEAWDLALAAAPDGTLALVVDTSASRNTVEFLSLGEDLVPRGEPVVLAREQDGIIPPHIAAFDGGWVVAWMAMAWSPPTMGPVELVWLDRTGALLGEPIVLADEVLIQSLALTVAEGAAYVAYDVSEDRERPELALRRLPVPR